MVQRGPAARTTVRRRKRSNKTDVDVSLEAAISSLPLISGGERWIEAGRPRLGRYIDLGVIGAGGMGEVRRVLDPDLNRPMAMKLLRQEWRDHPDVRARFVEEAQATAQLQHPSIVPVHELGVLPDGRPYFTMKEVRGKTLLDTLREVHAVAGEDRWQPAPSGWTFHRLIEAFRKVCEAVAYAHSRRVLHRDLKPHNVMVGDFGEVLVMDWGLAKVLGSALPEPTPPPEPTSEAPILTLRGMDPSLATRYGTVAGTPAYMPPEQAMGMVGQLGPTADVYSLGAILYEILAGHPPYEAASGRLVLQELLAGPPPPPRARQSSLPQQETVLSDEPPELSEGAPSPPQLAAGPPLPEELVAICERAMAREPTSRYPDASELCAVIAAWLEGAQRRERALREVETARALEPSIQELQARARALSARGGELLAAVHAWEPAERKQPGWTLLEQARRLEREAELAQTRRVQLLQAALSHDGELPEAHQELASYYRSRQEEAESARDERAAAWFEVFLRAHDRGAHVEFLRGEGTLNLSTDPPGATVEWLRYVVQDQRLVPQRVRTLGRTPLFKVKLPMGSHLLRLRAPGRQEVAYPVYLRRLEEWSGVNPLSGHPDHIYLPREGELGPDDVYVPGGWFQRGGDAEVSATLPAGREWAEPFVIRRFPVTNEDYLAFLNDLYEKGRLQEAIRWAPRQRGAPLVQLTGVVYGFGPDQGFFLQPDEDGDLWDPLWPVVNVDWESARAYARWEAERSGLPWRLPTEREWEKAARGVDGRWFPWGDFGDPAWACLLESHPGRPMPARVTDYPTDESPYGVRGMAGNMRDWCEDAYAPDESAPSSASSRIVRGGVYMARISHGRCAGRFWDAPSNTSNFVSFRLARSL